MHIEQLKLLASHVRGLLEHNNQKIGHSQSLDLIAALPGLRNWPEVQAFPARVAQSELDQISVGRLSFRLKKKFQFECSAQDLLTSFKTTGSAVVNDAPHIWPSGPVPGVYITTSQQAIDLMLDLYEEATDGAIVYAERAGEHSGSIDLGEYGLWSSGLDKVASGTLLVVGPLKLCQESWDDCAERLQMACLHAVNGGCRVAVLLDTPAAETLRQDVKLLVDSRDEFGQLAEEALRGAVTESGEFLVCSPFAEPWPVIHANQSTPRNHWAPDNLYSALSKSLKQSGVGLLALGSSKMEEFAAMELLPDVLNMTEHLGPAARVMPNHRSTPSKDWDVPDEVKALPYLPSIQSAYAQGYRRIIYSPYYVKSDVLLDYSADALLISTIFAGDVSEVFLSSTRLSHPDNYKKFAPRFIAIVATIEITSKQGNIVVSDLYVKNDNALGDFQGLLEFDEFIKDNRTLCWETQASQLLDSRKITETSLGKAFPRNNQPTKFLDARKNRDKRNVVKG